MIPLIYYILISLSSELGINCAETKCKRNTSDERGREREEKTVSLLMEVKPEESEENESFTHSWGYLEHSDRIFRENPCRK